MNQTIEIVITILKSMSMDKRPSTLTPGTSYYPSTSTRNDTNLPLEYQTPDVTRNFRRSMYRTTIKCAQRPDVGNALLAVPTPWVRSPGKPATFDVPVTAPEAIAVEASLGA